MSTAARPRMLFIDNLRIFLITMIVLLHLAVTYGGAGDWHYQEFTMEEAGLLAGIIFSLFTMTVIGFSVGCFFLIAGYFTPGSCDRKGRRRFLIDRLLRLGIPLVIYIVVFDPIIKFTVQRVA